MLSLIFDQISSLIYFLTSKMQSSPELFKATCRDKSCAAELFALSRNASVICFACGQHHEFKTLQNVEEICTTTDIPAVHRFLQFQNIESRLPKRGPDMVKVLGLSNYHCKLLSPFLTRYGLHKATGQPKLLREMNLGDIFDCSLFCDRAFRIEPGHIPIAGFGRDVTGSIDYLSETLKLIKSSNGGEERLLPIYTDGDGHCLVHSISRALVGRELFWHPLRCCLKNHFQTNLDKFKELFKDFIDTDEWQSIIDECDPEFKPPDGELHGLRNIHIFGLANVLKRPIILLDSLECMQKSGDYSALFLPGFVAPENCRGKDQSLNKPICIAWSSYSHNHYIPLVGVQKMPLPVLPKSLIPKVWGMPQSEVMSYMEFDEKENCIIGGSKILSDAYIQCLVNAMGVQFNQQHGVHPTLVADTKFYLCSNNVLLNTNVATVIHKARSLASEGRLFRCNVCKALSELYFDTNSFQRFGILYTYLNSRKQLSADVSHNVSTPNCFLTCRYDSHNDVLLPDKTTFQMKECRYCGSKSLEQLKTDGYPVKHSENKDETIAKVNSSNKPEPTPAKKDFIDIPIMLRIKCQYKDITIEDVIPDFKLVNEESLEGEVALCSMSFIKKHFPGKKDDTKLQKHIAETIFQTIGKSPPSRSDEKPKVEVSAQPMEVVQDTSVSSASETSNEITLESAKPEPKIIKVVSQNGKQLNLDLTGIEISYSELQNWIKEQFLIDIHHQRIKIGFPPKELEPPSNKSQVLCLKHSDRLMVENCPQPEKRFPSTPYIRNSSRDFSPLNNISGYQNEALWMLAKCTPEKFKKNGNFFEEANRQHILTDMTHVRINSFPNKTFAYNVFSSSLELCVKPLGHFQIGQDIDSRIEQVQEGESVLGYRKCPISSLRVSNRDPVINKAVKNSASTSTTETSAETLAAPLLRKGPGFSILTSPESEHMDIS